MNMTCCPHPGPAVWPLPIWPGHDPDLERLRRLEQAAEREAEKERIRQRLRQRGIPEDQIQGCWFPRAIVPLPGPPVRVEPCLDEVIRRIR